MTTLSIPDEKELLARLQVGDEEAFELVYRQYYAVLYLHAYKKLGDREVAKDLVQDLFAVIWQNRESLHIQSSLSAYLYSSVRNRILDIWAKEKNRNKYLASLSIPIDHSNSSVDSILQEKMLAEQIENTLLKLPPRVRQIFEMSRKHYLTYREIAEQLNLSEHTVRSYMKEAIKVFRFKFGSFLWLLFVSFIKYF